MDSRKVDGTSPVKEGDTIVVYFSCGAASAVALKTTIDKYKAIAKIVAVNNPVKEEDSDNRRFLSDVSKWLDIEVVLATNPKFPDSSCQTVWEKRRFMSNPSGAPCTQELKKKARQHWEASNKTDHMVMGFTADPEDVSRHERFILTERKNCLPVLIEAGLTKQDCFNILAQAGIELPNIYKLGYPNANCIGCVKATSPTYWNHVRKMHPEVFKQRAQTSRDVGARLVRVKGKRLFLDELDPSARGRSMKSMNIECGIFCEEKF